MKVIIHNKFCPNLFIKVSINDVLLMKEDDGNKCCSSSFLWKPGTRKVPEKALFFKKKLDVSFIILVYHLLHFSRKSLNQQFFTGRGLFKSKYGSQYYNCSTFKFLFPQHCPDTVLLQRSKPGVVYRRRTFKH